MKAITIWQPWASLIAIGAKPYEFRTRRAQKTVIGQRIAIHASVRQLKQVEIDDLIARLEDPSQAWVTALKKDIALPFLRRAAQLSIDGGERPFPLPRSAIVCTAILGVPVKSFTVVPQFGGPQVDDGNGYEDSNWAWPLTEIEPVEPPMPARGRQSFWNWDPEEGPLV